MVEMKRHLVAANHHATAYRVLARANRTLERVDVVILGERNRGPGLSAPEPFLRLVRLAFRGVWIVNPARVARGLEHVAAQANPLVDPLVGLLAHGQHAAVPRPILVAAQIVPLGVCAVIGADGNPRGHAALRALGIAAAVVFAARFLAHPIPLVLARLLLWAEPFPLAAHVAHFRAQPLHVRTLLGGLGPVLSLPCLRKGGEGGEKGLPCSVCDCGLGRRKHGHVNVLVLARVVTPAPQATVGIDARGQHLHHFAILHLPVPMVREPRRTRFRLLLRTRFTLHVPRLGIRVVE